MYLVPHQSAGPPHAIKKERSLAVFRGRGEPVSDREANRLPAPRGTFNLTMRIYTPKFFADVGVVMAYRGALMPD